MSDRTYNVMKFLVVLCISAVVSTTPPGCASSWNQAGHVEPQAQTAPDSPGGEPAGDARKFQPPREVDPEDVEAFRNAVDQISRLEYGPAESEMRILLVRFESVDDPKYVPEALFWLGYCCEKQGVLEQARDYYQRVVEHFENTRPGQQAAQRLKLLPAE